MGHARVHQWLRIDAAAMPGVYAALFEAASPGNLVYWLEVVFSAGIATLGLVLNSPAVIIGAMLISPLMGPILAAGLALAMGDLYLGIKAVFSLAASTAVSIGLAAGIVWLLPFHSPTAEILSRTNPNLLDLGVAILSGLAGSLVVGRGTSGGATALPGVAIAVALMPPLCAVGFGIGSGGGSGGGSGIIGGAALLFLTNLVAIVASAFAVFLLIRMDGDEVRAEIDRSRSRHAEADPVYRLIGGTALARTFAAGGRIYWRVLMLAVLLAAVFVPLKNALEQVKDEVVARTAVQDAMRSVAPAGALVSHQVAITPQEIRISLIATQNVKAAQIESARQILRRKTGRAVDIHVEEVASRSELRAVLERLPSPQPPPAPQPPELPEIGKQAIDAVGPVLAKMWPGDELPLLGYELALTPAGEVLRIQYQGKQDLPAQAIAVIEAALRVELKADELQVEVRRTPPARAPRGRRAG